MQRFRSTLLARTALALDENRRFAQSSTLKQRECASHRYGPAHQRSELGSCGHWKRTAVMSDLTAQQHVPERYCAAVARPASEHLHAVKERAVGAAEVPEKQSLPIDFKLTVEALHAGVIDDNIVCWVRPNGAPLPRGLPRMSCERAMQAGQSKPAYRGNNVVRELRDQLGRAGLHRKIRDVHMSAPRHRARE